MGFSLPRVLLYRRGQNHGHGHRICHGPCSLLWRPLKRLRKCLCWLVLLWLSFSLERDNAMFLCACQVLPCAVVCGNVNPGCGHSSDYSGFHLSCSYAVGDSNSVSYLVSVSVHSSCRLITCCSQNALRLLVVFVFLYCSLDQFV